MLLLTTALLINRAFTIYDLTEIQFRLEELLKVRFVTLSSGLEGSTKGLRILSDTQLTPTICPLIQCHPEKQQEISIICSLNNLNSRETSQFRWPL